MDLLGPFLPIHLFPRFRETSFGSNVAPKQRFVFHPLLLGRDFWREICPQTAFCLLFTTSQTLSFGSNVSDADSKICRGLGKKASLLQELGTPTIDVMRSIKKALDPYWLMNPGKIFEPTNEGTNDEGAATAASTLGRPAEGH